MNSKSNISGPTYGQPSSQKSKQIISQYTPSLLSSDSYGKSSQGKRQYPTQEPIVKTTISTPYAGQRSNNLDMNKFTLSNNTYLASTPSKQQPSTSSGSQYNQQSTSSQYNQQSNKQSQQQFQSKSESYQSPFQNSAPLYSQTIQRHIQPQISETMSQYPPNDLRAYNQLQQQSNIMNHQQINSTKNYMKDEIKPSSNKIPYERETNTIQKQWSNVGIAGLRNIGNTCFMNSVLQCIMNTPRFNDSFIDRSFAQQLHPKNKGIATEYSQLIQKVRQSPNFSSENTNGLKRAIELQSPQFAGYDQQDAQEFMIAFLEGINQDMNRVTTKSPYKEMNDDLQKQSVQKLSQDWWDYQKSREYSIIQDYFMGQLLNKVICQYCQKESLAFDAFIDIQLSISRSQTILDDMELERLIDLFLKEEQLDEAFCSRCKKLQKSKRKFLIWRLPNILIFTIKRFNFRRFGSGKLSNKIKLPIKNLDLCNLVKESSDPSTKNCQYELYGIVNHSGTLSSGHYTADCKSPIDEKWYRFNDSNVREIDITHQGYETNGSSDPYIIFYRRKQL